MININMKSSLSLTLMGIALTLMAGGAFADKPTWAGGNKHKEEKKHSEQGYSDDRYGSTVTFSFGSDDRRIVSEYYGAQAQMGKCPPGFGKKEQWLPTAGASEKMA